MGEIALGYELVLLNRGTSDRLHSLASIKREQTKELIYGGTVKKIVR